MNSPTDDRDLEAYLTGGSEISRRYRALAQEVPTRTLDRAVLIEARTAAEEDRPAGAARRRGRWKVPLAIAATVVLSLAVLREAGMDSLPVSHVSSPVMQDTDAEAGGAAMTIEETAPPAALPPAPAEQTSRQTRREEQTKAQAAARDWAPMSRRLAPAPARLEAADVPPTNEAGAGLVDHAFEPAPAPAGEAPTETNMTPPRAASVTGVSMDAAAEGRAGRLAQRPPDPWLSDIRALLAKGRKEQAQAEFRRFLEAWPDYFKDHPDALETLAEAPELKALMPPDSKQK